MPLTSKGVDIALKRVPTTGKFDIDWDLTQNPSFTDDRSHLVLSLLLEYQGKYWADNSGRRGSLLYLVKQDVSATKSLLDQYVQDALSPAVDDGRLKSFTKSVKRDAPGRYTITLYWVTPDGVKGDTILSLGY
jgi:phage gp46-like protein